MNLREADRVVPGLDIWVVVVHLSANAAGKRVDGWVKRLKD
jgi:hypothetical protein